MIQLAENVSFHNRFIYVTRDASSHANSLPFNTMLFLTVILNIIGCVNLRSLFLMQQDFFPSNLLYFFCYVSPGLLLSLGETSFFDNCNKLLLNDLPTWPNLNNVLWQNLGVRHAPTGSLRKDFIGLEQQVPLLQTNSGLHHLSFPPFFDII